MRFSTHIKFHCQFLCRFPWKRSFLVQSPHENMHGVPSLACICWTLSRLCHWQIIIFWPGADMAWSTLGQDTIRGSSEGFVVRRAAENYWGPTQISLQKQPSWAWRAQSAGSGAYSVTDCCPASSRHWQDKEILFILTNFFVVSEEAWSFFVVKATSPLSSDGVFVWRKSFFFGIRDKSE